VISPRKRSPGSDWNAKGAQKERTVDGLPQKKGRRGHTAVDAKRGETDTDYKSSWGN